MNISTGNLEYHGNQGVIVSDYGTLKTDKKGIETCTATFMIRKDKMNLLPKKGSPHPIWSYIAMEERQVKLDGGFAVATCDYAGIESEATQVPRYELQMGTSDEPIQTHPQFDTKIGGTPKNPLNGALWRLNSDPAGVVGTGLPTTAASNDNYAFWKFSDNTGTAKNPFAGIETYFEGCSVTWSKTTNSKSHASDLAKAGKIDDPEGPAPTLPKGYTWLNMGTSSTQKGSAFEHTTTWKASGRRGWNTTIYGKA